MKNIPKKRKSSSNKQKIPLKMGKSPNEKEKFSQKSFTENTENHIGPVFPSNWTR
jgi:hypothetical protein